MKKATRDKRGVGRGVLQGTEQSNRRRFWLIRSAAMFQFHTLQAGGVLFILCKRTLINTDFSRPFCWLCSVDLFGVDLVRLGTLASST